MGGSVSSSPRNSSWVQDPDSPSPKALSRSHSGSNPEYRARGRSFHMATERLTYSEGNGSIWIFSLMLKVLFLYFIFLITIILFTLHVRGCVCFASFAPTRSVSEHLICAGYCAMDFLHSVSKLCQGESLLWEGFKV